MSDDDRILLPICSEDGLFLTGYNCDDNPFGPPRPLCDAERFARLFREVWGVPGAGKHPWECLLNFWRGNDEGQARKSQPIIELDSKFPDRGLLLGYEYEMAAHDVRAEGHHLCFRPNVMDSMPDGIVKALVGHALSWTEQYYCGQASALEDVTGDTLSLSLHRAGLVGLSLDASADPPSEVDEWYCDNTDLFWSGSGSSFEPTPKNLAHVLSYALGELEFFCVKAKRGATDLYVIVQLLREAMRRALRIEQPVAREVYGLCRCILDLFTNPFVSDIDYLLGNTEEEVRSKWAEVIGPIYDKVERRHLGLLQQLHARIETELEIERRSHDAEKGGPVLRSNEPSAWLGVDSSTDSSFIPAPDELSIHILQFLDRARKPVRQIHIAAKMERHTNTISPRLARLTADSLVEYPYGPRSGVSITSKGRELASRYPPEERT